MVAVRRLSWLAGVVALIACLGISYAAYMLADYSWNQVAEYDSPYATYDRDRGLRDSLRQPPAAQDTSATPRTVLVLIDGLTLEASRDYMTALNTVRQYGADMVARTAEPSLSYPMWTNVLSGAPPDISGVTTNWFEGPVKVDTLFDSLVPRPVIVSASEDFEPLYEVGRVATYVHLEPWNDDKYVSATIVDEALAMAERDDAALVFVYLPDADHVAHEEGPESEAYADVVAQIDRDLSRLIDGLQDDRTMFVVTADHGHIRGGGHGGWEPEATRVPAVFFGPGTRFDEGEISQSDIAPTIAAFLGADVPSRASGKVRDNVVRVEPEVLERAQFTYRAFAEDYAEVIDGTAAVIGGASTYEQIDEALASVTSDRLAEDRAARLPLALLVAGGALAALLLIGAASWRALVAALSGTAAYYVVYNGLYFVVHGHRWSLSAFNTETYLQTFFNLRMVEAAAAGIVAALVAGAVYPLLRREPKGPRRTYLGGWLSLGPATILAVQSTLALQVAWFLWAWGAEVTWRLPDLGAGFKYDLDLIQSAALGGAVLLSPVVTYLVGRYHPKVRRTEARFAQEVSEKPASGWPRS